MRLFQNSAIYPAYRPRLATLTGDCRTFEDYVEVFLNDRFGSAHFLKPILDRDRDAFFANGDDQKWQRQWAKEQGMSVATSLDDILFAQIEHHRTEVFYNLDPMRYGDSFVARLPGCVRRTVAWRAAPSRGGRFLKHDIVVNNFPSLLTGYRDLGVRAEYLAPAHDQAMDEYSTQTERPIDVLFVGTFSRHHRARAAMLEAIAEQRTSMSVVMHLDTSRYTRLAESPIGWIGPLRKDRRSLNIRKVARQPVFGRDLLRALSSAKTVVNGAIDMAGADRGNMRVWEALGCRAALVSDRGNYPNGIEPGVQFEVYDDAADVPAILSRLMNDPARREKLADNGYAAISKLYSKAAQWNCFVKIAG